MELKATLFGPRPFGGTATVCLTNPNQDKLVENMLRRGYTVKLVWIVPPPEQLAEWRRQRDSFLRGIEYLENFK